MKYGIQVPLLSNPEYSSWTPKSTALNSESNQYCLQLPNTRRRLRRLPLTGENNSLFTKRIAHYPSAGLGVTFTAKHSRLTQMIVYV